MKLIELTDHMTGDEVYANAEIVTAVYTEKEMCCTAVEMQNCILYVKESPRAVLNALYQANYEEGFLFHPPKEVT